MVTLKRARASTGGVAMIACMRTLTAGPGKQTPPPRASANGGVGEGARRQPPQFSPIAFIRFTISSSLTSSTCVESVQMWPNGSFTVPDRSP